MKTLAITRNGRSHSCPRSLFIELVVVREVCGCKAVLD